MRKQEVVRKTAETDIKLKLNLDGAGKSRLSTGNGFFDHMLTLFACHSRFDLEVVCAGDTHVDFHHSAEDIGISLGRAFKIAVGDKAGVKRYGSFILPMDESLALCAVDLSGRAYLNFDMCVPLKSAGGFDGEDCKEFFAAFAREAAVTLHIKLFYGENTHHIMECLFKAFARALSQAVETDVRANGEIPSTKGEL